MAMKISHKSQKAEGYSLHKEDPIVYVYSFRNTDEFVIATRWHHAIYPLNYDNISYSICKNAAKLCLNLIFQCHFDSN